MFTDDLPVDGAVERRRAAEVERKARIFNTRIRVIGVDQDALDKQVWEKKQLQNKEKQKNKAFDDLNRLHDEELLRQERDQKKRRAAVHAELTRFWATEQRVEDSLDADLKCDPTGVFEIPFPEDELGPASMKVFEGECPGEKERKREQMKETERDLRAQREEDEQRLRVAMHKEMLMSKELMHHNLRATQLQALEEECKKTVRIAMDNYNHALAAQQAERLKEQQRRVDGQDRADVLHAATSDMLTERPEAAVRDVGEGKPHRVLVDRWRGMTPDELSAIHREQEAQRIARQKQCEAEKVLEAAWNLQQLEISREAEVQRKREEWMRRVSKIQLDQHNMQLAEEQKIQQEYLDKRVYTNEPTKEYFDQFNTTSR